jgi:hypothetical protein
MQKGIVAPLHEKSVIGSVSHFSEIHKRPNFISPFIYKIISGFYAKKTPAVSFAEHCGCLG